MYLTKDQLADYIRGARFLSAAYSETESYLKGDVVYSCERAKTSYIAIEDVPSGTEGGLGNIKYWSLFSYAEETPKNSHIFPFISKILPSIAEFLLANDFVVVKAGQRSGKTVIAREVVRLGSFDRVYLFTFNPEVDEERFGVPVVLMQNFDIPEDLNPRIGSPVVVFEEAFWVKQSYDMFEKLRELEIPVFVLGSNGTEFDSDERWNLLPGFSISSWVANTNISKEDCLGTNLSHLQNVRDFSGF